MNWAYDNSLRLLFAGQRLYSGDYYLALGIDYK